MTTYLMDTSVLVEHERGNEIVSARLQDLVLAGHRLAICEPVAMELLAGALSARSAAATRDIIDGFPSIPLGDWTAFRRAGYLVQEMSRAGRRPRGVIDCLIAVCALEAQDTVLLHNDRDYEAIAEFIGLRQERLAVA